MKRMKQLTSIVLALVLALALAVPAMAAGATTGSITIKDSDTVSVANKTFKAYKILDTELANGTNAEGGVVYKVPAGLEDFYATRFTLDKTKPSFHQDVTGKIADMASNSDALFDFAAAALAAAKAANITFATGEVKNGDYVIDDLPLGYYVIEDEGTATPISALVLDTTTPDIETKIKADLPKIDKKIDGNKDTDDNTTGMVEANTAAVGDKVPYVVTSKVPDMTGYTKYYFVVTDTLSKGLTFNNDVAITVGTKTLTKDTDFTVASSKNADGTTSVEIVFKSFIQYAAAEYKNADITITYSATINEDAVIGELGNPNKVILTYSNNPNKTNNGDSTNPDKPDPSGDKVTGDTPNEVVSTYVTGIELTKVDNKGNRLTGAEFKITGEKLNKVKTVKEAFAEDENGTYYLLKNGTYTETAPNGENGDQYADTSKKYAKSTETVWTTTSSTVHATAVVGSDGVLRFEGLAEGTYTIEEIKAPNGYNILKQPITVVIKCEEPAAVTDGTEKATWKYSASGAMTIDETTANGGIIKLSVVNETGLELPSTGGMGTTIFYVLGTILVLGAGVLLIAKKRMSVED